MHTLFLSWSSFFIYLQGPTLELHLLIFQRRGLAEPTICLLPSVNGLPTVQRYRSTAYFNGRQFPNGTTVSPKATVL